MTHCLFLTAALAFLALSPAAFASTCPLPGKVLQISYENGSRYSVRYDHATLTWKGLAGSDRGKSETDRYSCTKMKNNLFYVYWRERDGTTVQSLLNFDRSSLETNIRSGSSSEFLKGSFQAITP